MRERDGLCGRVLATGRTKYGWCQWRVGPGSGKNDIEEAGAGIPDRRIDPQGPGGGNGAGIEDGAVFQILDGSICLKLDPEPIARNIAAEVSPKRARLIGTTGRPSPS